MGWWKTDGTENVIGDLPLDVLGPAMDAVVSQYRAAWGRAPTKGEWAALCFAVLGAKRDVPCVEDGEVTGVRID